MVYYFFVSTILCNLLIRLISLALYCIYTVRKPAEIFWNRRIAFKKIINEPNVFKRYVEDQI